MSININHFFNYGYSVSQIPVELADALLETVRKQNYSVCDGTYKSNLEAPLLASWNSELLPKTSNIGETPPILESLQAILKEMGFLNWFEINFGVFSQFSVMVNKFSKNNGMIWHNDHLDSTFLSVLIYLSKDIFEENDGGYLELGRIYNTDYVMDARPPSEEVSLLRSVLPNHGTIVLLNNTQITSVHRVEKMISDKERYTILCHFGYWQNIVHKKRK
jgi:hypothetical protein